METKVCKQCAKEKLIKDFPWSWKAKGYRRTLCKVCYSEYTKRYKGKYKQSIAEASKKYAKTINGRAHLLCGSKKKRAIDLGLDFDLTPDWFEERLKSGCEVTNLSFQFGKLTPFSPSVDRINPDKGYIKSNCRLVLWGVNSLKGAGTDDDMFKIAKEIFLHSCIQ